MMTAEAWPDHLLTLEEFIELPEDNSRRNELQEGVLLASPRATPLHRQVMMHLAMALHHQSPAEWRAVVDTELVVEPGFPPTVRVPDLVIVPTAAVKANPPRFTADEVLVAVEIISPGSRGTDTRQVIDLDEPFGLPSSWRVRIPGGTSGHRPVRDERAVPVADRPDRAARRTRAQAGEGSQ